ncbi:hypothetical protein GCM10022267_34300 [Lentzea roselyniae]|uniref:Uncharacterized protein n=1 Tax=Lentzea roselyniae TaxID=531940 RepID=A0ABP7B153_9PSEU
MLARAALGHDPVLQRFPATRAQLGQQRVQQRGADALPAVPRVHRDRADRQPRPQSHRRDAHDLAITQCDEPDELAEVGTGLPQRRDDPVPARRGFAGMVDGLGRDPHVRVTAESGGLVQVEWFDLQHVVQVRTGE